MLVVLKTKAHGNGSMPRFEAIVWDLDGTLVDTAPDLATTLNTILDQHRIAPLPLSMVRPLVGNGAKKMLERGFEASGEHIDDAQLDILFHQFIQIYSVCATQQSQPYPQIVETLEQFRRMNIPMGVCTNKPEGLSRQILDGLGLSEYFSSLVGGDTLPTHKPDPQPLLRCLDELATAPRDGLMVGDSAVDVGAARAAGVAVAVVPWGYRYQPVEDLGADFILHDLGKLRKLMAYGSGQSQFTKM